MSYRAITKRIRYIDSRLRNKRDYPSAPEIAQGLLDEHGEDVSTRTIQRDIELLRERGAPIEYESHRHSYYYTDETRRPNAEILEPPELRERAREWFAGAAERYSEDNG